MPSTMPRPPGVIGMTAKMLASPNATSRRVDLERAAERPQEHPQRGRVEQPVEAGPQQHPLAAARGRRSAPRAARRPGAAPSAAVSGSKRSLRPSQRRNGSARPWPCCRPRTSRATTSMIAQAGEGGRDVQRVDAAQRDRDQQGDPEDQVEHDGRAEPGRGQREAGVGAADARQRHQPVAERRAGGAAAGHDVAERLGAHLDAEHAHPRDLAAGLAERRAGQQRVARTTPRSAAAGRRRGTPGRPW